jgi:hypothetical protein
VRAAWIRTEGLSSMSESQKNMAIWGGLAVIGLLVLLAFGWLLQMIMVRPEIVGQTVVATPAAEVAGTPKVGVPIKAPVAVYRTTPALKKNLALPQQVIDDQRESVLASSKIAAGEHGKTVTTVINTETGKSETYVRTDPLPWLAFESRGEVGVYYGIKNGQQAVRIAARQDFVQVKALHLGVIGSVDLAAGRPDYFAGVGVAYRW